jgi:lipid II:glycine glycyltransferase (peptidoglycan interpeptide bridge formation enzyme)
MAKHVVQSSEWGTVKSACGTPAVRVGDIQYTKHKVPFTDYYYGYCPKVDPNVIDFDGLKKSLLENNCINVNFDVPNIVANTPEATKAIEIFTSQGCEKSPRDQFAKSNILLDLSPAADDLLNLMHPKQRYNSKYAQKKGVIVKTAQTQQDFDIFYSLLGDTAERQKYYVKNKSYYQKIWDILRPLNMCHVLTAEYEGIALASWMLFVYEGVLYYPFGGSSEKHKNLFASTLLGWEAILLGKKLCCTTFDMWGAADNIDDTTDPWWGFTNFKLKFGGKYVKYMDSYDLIVNGPMYKAFSLANNLRWKILKAVK